MAAVTQAPPVTPIPEQALVTSVSLHVVNVSGLRVSSLLQTLLAQRMRLQELLPCFPPCCRVPSGRGGPYLLGVHSFVSLAVLGSRRNQRGTPGMSAGNLWFEWHRSVLLKTKPRRACSLRGIFSRSKCSTNRQSNLPRFYTQRSLSMKLFNFFLACAIINTNE